jgi:hypothetical protein
VAGIAEVRQFPVTVAANNLQEHLHDTCLENATAPRQQVLMERSLHLPVENAKHLSTAMVSPLAFHKRKIALLMQVAVHFPDSVVM